MNSTDERFLNENKTLITRIGEESELNEIEKSSRKSGSLNYIMSNGELFLTIDSPRIDKQSSNIIDGTYDRIIKESQNGKIKRDLTFEGKITIEDKLVVLGEAIAIPVDALRIEDTIIEINKAEKNNGITNKRAGFSVNRGSEGYANILYDEIEGGFNFCIDNKSNEDYENNPNIASKLLIEHKHVIATINNQKEFDLPISLQQEQINILFINSIFYNEDFFSIIDNKLNLNNGVDKDTEVYIMSIALSQENNSDRILEDNEKSKLMRKYQILKSSFDGQKQFPLSFEPKESDESILVFCNGVLISPSLYSINGNMLKLEFETEIDTETCVVVLYAKDRKSFNKVKMMQNLHTLITTTKNEKEFTLPFSIKDNRGVTLLFVNSVFVEKSDYSIVGNILSTSRDLAIDTELSIISISPINNASYSERMSDIRTKDSFNNLMLITKDGILKVKESIETKNLDVNDSAKICNLTINEKGNNALTVNGKTKLNGSVEINNMISLNDLATFNEKSVFNKDVVFHKDPVFNSNKIFFNADLKEEDGEISLERKTRPHAIIKWKENIKRWTAGLEGSERPIVTQDALERVIDKIIDLCDVDSNIVSEVTCEQETLFITNSVQTFIQTRFEEAKDHLTLIFANSRLILPDEYVHEDKDIEFNKSLEKDTEISIIHIGFLQEDITGYDLKEIDKVQIEKKIHSVIAERANQKEFYMPFDLDDCDEAIMVFVNGLFLTKDMYLINGSLITILYDTEEPLELIVMAIKTLNNLSLSKLEVLSQNIRIKACVNNQTTFEVPTDINLNKIDKDKKDNFLVFSNTTLLPKEHYKLEGRLLTLTTEGLSASVPTELSLVVFKTYNSRRCNGSSDQIICSRRYSTKGELNKKIFDIPFLIDPSSSSLMVFYGGLLQRREDYIINGKQLSINNPSTVSAMDLSIVDFVNKNDPSQGLNGKGTSNFNITIEQALTRMYTLPFIVDKEKDTCIVFINGSLAKPEDYTVNGATLMLKRNLQVNDNIQITNFTNTVSINYVPVFKEKVIIDQLIVSNNWNINHNLKTYPHITVIDDNNKVIKNVDVIYIDENNISITLEIPYKGKVILS